MKTFLHILIFLILNPFLAIGQGDYNWVNKIPEMTLIPDSLSNEDAVIISYIENRSIYKEKSFINTAITIRKKIKILTKKGIQEHSFFDIKQSDDMVMEILDARTIKRNGVILDFESNEIKSIESKSQIAGRTKDLFFAIPGVEVGDEIEMICIYTSTKFHSNDYVYFHQTIPVMESTFSIEAPKELLVKSNVYGGLQLPEVQYLIQTNLISWTSTNNRKVDTEDTLYNLPHMIYDLDYRHLIQAEKTTFYNWYHLITYYEKSVFKPKIRDKQKFKTQWKEIANGETDQVILLQRIHAYLNQNMTIEPIRSWEQKEGITYFIEQKKANQNTLIKIYFALFEMAGIDAKIAIGKSRQIGPIDLRIPTPAQISNFLFVVKNQDGMTLFAPKEEENQYKLHQLPEHIYGTDIYITSSKKRKKLLQIKIPPQDN